MKRLLAAVSVVALVGCGSAIPSCYEDEAIVLIVAQVQPDDGKPPAVDFAPVGELVGQFGCVPVSDLPVSGNRP